MARYVSLIIAAILALTGTTCQSAECPVGKNSPKVQTLQFPMLLGGAVGDGPYQMLPKGTTLYYDKSYPEGFTRYIIYVNVDRYPLSLTTLSDPTAIVPITAFALDKEDLKRLLDRNPITKEDLRAILGSDQLSKQEIREILREYAE
jgi:hypothetical protein